MKNTRYSSRFVNLVLAGLATACVLAWIPETGTAAPFGDRFSARFGRGSNGYSSYGRGRYGYGNSFGNGFSGNRNNSFPLYGQGRYGYQNGYSTGYGNSGYSGWNSNYNNYTPYGYNYYYPVSSWSYSPFGFGLQQSYGW